MPSGPLSQSDHDHEPNTRDSAPLDPRGDRNLRPKPEGTTGDRRLTAGYLLAFSLPLALTFLMMSGSAPLVSTGIAWVQGAEGERIHLSAFLMAFVVALFIYSPMFVARNVAIRTVTDRRSLWAYASFFVTCASVSSVVLVLVSQVDAWGEMVFGQVLAGSAIQQELAREGLLIFVPIPILVAIRGLGQGSHIANGQTWYVGTGTVMRFIAMATFVFGYGIHSQMPGPVLGGCTYLVGIGAETVFVLATLLGKRQLTEIQDTPTMRFGDYLRYAGPLMLGSILHQFSGPTLIYIINHAGQPAENGAAFDLVRDSAWIMVSMLMTIQAVIIHHATSRRNLWVIIRFALMLGLAITAVAATLALTPLRTWLFVGVLRVDNVAIREITYVALIWLIPLPMITMVNHFMMSMHTRSGRTGWVTAGNIVGISVLISIVLLVDLPRYNGAVVAVLSQSAFQIVAGAVQLLGLRRGGLDAVVSQASMAQIMQATACDEDPEAEPELAPEPAPERVRP